MRHAFLLAFAAALGCTSQVIIGTAECSTLYGGCSTGGTPTVFGSGGAPFTTTSEPAGSFTVTNTLTISGCGTVILWCAFSASQCVCSTNCPQGQLEAQCASGSADDQQCDCLNNGQLVETCTGPLPEAGALISCGQAGLGCCDAVFGVSM